MADTEFSYSNPCCGIYRIFHVPTGKSYIGSSCRIYGRWIAHRGSLRKGRHHSRMLQRAWNKYGESAFQVEIVEHVEDPGHLIARENFYIQAFMATVPALGYNTAPAAGTTRGLKLGPLSEEHRRKIGEGQRGRTMSEELKIRMGNRHRGKKLSEEHLRILRERTGTSNHFFGKKHAVETIRKMSGDGHHSSRAVVCIETGQRFGSITAASAWLRQNGKPSASRSPIWSCCHGSTRYSTAYGYTWRFEDGLAQHVAVDPNPRHLTEVAVIGDDLRVTS